MARSSHSRVTVWALSFPRRRHHGRGSRFPPLSKLPLLVLKMHFSISLTFAFCHRNVHTCQFSLQELFLHINGAPVGSFLSFFSACPPPNVVYRIAADMGTDGASTRFGALRLDEISRQHLVLLQTGLRRKYSVSTINRCMSVIKAILESAMEERLIMWNPSKGLRMLKDTKNPPA